MSNKILAFGASNSKASINRKLAKYAASQVSNAEVNLLDLNDFEMPLYGIDKENNTGIPQLAHDFKAHIKAADGIIISFAEHNGNYSVAFKNIFDWISRIEKDVWLNKPMLLLATSPGPRGGQSVLEIAFNKLSFMNKNTVLKFSLPSFFDNFNENDGITDESINSDFRKVLSSFESVLK